MAWKPTAEAIALLGADQLNNLRKNADDRQQAEVVALCDAEIARRKPAKPVKAKKAKAPKAVPSA